MIDYKKWPRKVISVTSLKLDDQNPRLPDYGDRKPTQPEIIRYLIENEDVLGLAKKIAVQGYFANEEPIVCYENNKLIVLEGNRRVAACKLIVNPDLIESNAKRKNLQKLLVGFDMNIVKKLEIKISPNREEADELIVNRHTEGSAIEKWDKTKQDKFFYTRHKSGESVDTLAAKFNVTKSFIKDAFKRYNFYRQLLDLDLPKDQKDKITDETKFNITSAERFYSSKLGKEFLLIDFDSNGDIIVKTTKAEFKKRLKRIAVDIIEEKLNSRTYGDAEKQNEYIKTLLETDEFKSNSNHAAEEDEAETENHTPDPKNDTKEEKKENQSGKTPKSTPDNKLISFGIKWHTKIDRINKIFRELKAANLDTQFNSTAVLFRSYLDMLVYQYLHKNGGIADIMKEAQKKLDESNDKQILSVTSYIINIGAKASSIQERDLKKALKQRAGVSSSWVPSLKEMLSFLSKSDLLLPDVKLRQALASYVKGNDAFLDHNDFNLLVHNEYFIKNGADLKKIWAQLKPILEFINQKLSE